jgi:hypothetical protein
LIVDTPNTCGDCACYEAVYGVCDVEDESCDYDSRPDWCPMKDVELRVDCAEEN